MEAHLFCQLGGRPVEDDLQRIRVVSSVDVGDKLLDEWVRGHGERGARRGRCGREPSSAPSRVSQGNEAFFRPLFVTASSSVVSHDVLI
jgi:hypothetical protein